MLLPDPEATDELAGRLALALPDDIGGWMILLQGDLGSGKSTVARAMLRKLGHSGSAPSPTYTLIEPYDVSGKSIYHIDLYRISDTEELDFLGWSDLEDGLRLVEWPERVPGLAGQADVRLSLRYEGAGRSATLEALSERGASYLQRVGSSTGSDRS